MIWRWRELLLAFEPHLGHDDVASIAPDFVLAKLHLLYFQGCRVSAGDRRDDPDLVPVFYACPSDSFKVADILVVQVDVDETPQTPVFRV
jgi:hypothetical protein